ncbi:MAG: DUF554 domain-containing protein [Peptococcaceae bacterium]|nr:DUF554 domain-containing protein [Peptococcaceae bacterium]MBO5366484.1 DUF554 domain-containing protein [Peptococcaceae bacterium]MBP3625266.1 DUF554 domain-containing protein [Peptococcaceae bacterium]
MIGFGTIINCIGIVIGGVLGLIFGNLMKERLREILMTATALCVLFIGIGGALQEMMTVEGNALSSGGTMMMIASFAIGSLIGELLNLEYHIERFGEWLKQKTGNANEAGFVDAFVTASLTVCIGAMAVVGAIQDGMEGDYSVLAAKAVLDLIIILIMTASMGKGCIFSAIPVALFQGSITLLAQFVKPLMTAAALSNLSFVGSMMIFCVGANLFWNMKIRVANMLPGLIIAVLWAFLPI